MAVHKKTHPRHVSIVKTNGKSSFTVNFNSPPSSGNSHMVLFYSILGNLSIFFELLFLMVPKKETFSFPFFFSRR